MTPLRSNPCDTFKLCASKGEFSVEGDRANVNATLAKMIHAKAKYYDLDLPVTARYCPLLPVTIWQVLRGAG